MEPTTTSTSFTDLFIDGEHEPVPVDLLDLHEALEAQAAGLIP